jgi:hypothetical protein
MEGTEVKHETARTAAPWAVTAVGVRSLLTFRMIYCPLLPEGQAAPMAETASYSHWSAMELQYLKMT